MTNKNYKVKDISLADWGRKEIKLAEAEMPVISYWPMIGFLFEIPRLVPITYSADASFPKK